MYELEKAFGNIAKEQTKSNIERIISSYRHPWDVFTELIQNSVDALIDQFEEDLSQGQIVLSLFPEERKLIIEDNGCGISNKDISGILVVGESLKRKENRGKYGFMGYGLTFVAFQSEKLIIESVHENKKTIRTFNGLYKYIFTNETVILGSEEEMNQLDASSETIENNYTKITVVFPMNLPNEARDNDIKIAFNYAHNIALIKSILRTRTAVGTLDTLFDDKKTFNFTLNVDNTSEIIVPKYLTQREILQSLYPNESRIKDIEQDYQILIDATEGLPLKQQQDARRVILLDKKIFDLNIGTIKGRLYLTATSKDHLNEFNKRKLCIDDKDKTTSSFYIENGLWLAIGGMPTGIRLDSYEHSKDLPFTAIIDVYGHEIKKDLDAGRKGISEYRKLQIINIVREEFRKNNFYKYRNYVVGSNTRISDPLSDPKQSLIKKYNEKQTYNIDLIQKYLPPIEEQEVIALFIELCARSILKGYNLKTLSGYEIYDGLLAYTLEKNNSTILSDTNTLGINESIFARYADKINKDEVVIEFKIDLEALYKNIHVNQKDLNHIDIVICWKINSNQDEINENGDILRLIDNSEKFYYGITHELITGRRQQPLPIIELKSIVNYIYNLNI